ncbi:MAG: site-2 protease family protein, partial [Eubacteriales bacterium]|nr:site-2 protease family protein [Eubacteriales bacterium]
MGLLGNGNQDFLVSLIYVLPAVIIALTFHEFGHAYVANLNGDPTARILGRMTLNPFKHIDPLGFL